MSRDPALPGRVLSPQRGHHVAVAAATALTPGARQAEKGCGRPHQHGAGRASLEPAGCSRLPCFPFSCNSGNSKHNNPKASTQSRNCKAAQRTRHQNPACDASAAGPCPPLRGPRGKGACDSRARPPGGPATVMSRVCVPGPGLGNAHAPGLTSTASAQGRLTGGRAAEHGRLSASPA